MRTMLQHTLSVIDIDKAEKQLQKFVKDFELLYRPINCCPNIHYIWHYGDSVRRHGPLWVNSMFPYENANGALKSIVHAHFKPCLAIMNSVTLLNNVYERLYSIASLSPEFFQLFQNFQPTMAAQLAFKVKDDNPRVIIDIHISGKLHMLDPHEPCFNALRAGNPTLILQDVNFYRKLLKSNHLWSACQSNNSNDSVTKFKLNDTMLYGVVIRFAQHDNTILALIAVLKPRRPPVWCPSTYRTFYRETDEVAVIPVTQLADVQVSIIEQHIIYTIRKAMKQV
eukprot:Pompholyxophrys_sp_v1_NODE_49_length_3016_cov_4.701891.p2 type:complete len:282 gc:universal NODE_49_length_3016_cov_4.701891:866-21(-)